jgi:hypothetical protein
MTSLTQLKHSALYSEELGINLATRDDEQYFRWFLASRLFGGHISETIARHTYQAFCRHQLTTPGSILAAGWDFLVDPRVRAVRLQQIRSDIAQLPDPGRRVSRQPVAAA